MSSATEQRSIASRGLRQTLAEVRARIRAYVAVEGAAATVFCLAVAFWLLLGIDWLFEPRLAFRFAYLAIAALGVLAVCYRKLISRLFRRLPDANLALLMERRFRGLNDSLLTSVELQRSDLTPNARAMFAGALRDAEARIVETRPEDLFDTRPRNRALIAASIVLAAIGFFAAWSWSDFVFGVTRMTGFENEDWPRRTHLSIEGFTEHRDAKGRVEYLERVVARNTNVGIVVFADAEKHVPDVVYLRYASADGRSKKELTLRREGIVEREVEEIREGNVVRVVKPFQRFTLPNGDVGALQGISTSLVLDVRGGDGRIRDLRVRVVDRPTLAVDLVCDFPAYTGVPDVVLPNVGATEDLKQNTVVTVRAASSKPLRRAIVVEDLAGGDAIRQTFDYSEGEPATSFEFPIGLLTADSDWSFQLLDVDGIENTVNLKLHALIDEPPKFKSFVRRGVGDKITPQARLPFEGEVTDDYGLARIWFAYSTAEGPPLERAAAHEFAGAATAAVIADKPEVASLSYGVPVAPPQVGQTLNLQILAQDNRTGPDGEPDGQATAGDSFTFEVVSDAELLQDLRAREKELREQFKLLIVKMDRDRDSLQDIGEKPAAQPAAPGQKSDRTVVQQARLHTKENRDDVARIAANFAGMVEEIDNNRIGKSPTGQAATGQGAPPPNALDYGKLLENEAVKLSERYAVQIAGPLGRLVTAGPPPRPGATPVASDFDEYEALLVRLQVLVESNKAAAGDVEAARLAADAKAGMLIARMNDVLTAMEKMKSFDETVAMLRTIIALQKEIRESTDTNRNDPKRLLELRKRP